MTGPVLFHPIRPDRRTRGVLLLLHGRNKTAQSILPLARELDLPDHVVVAPQAPEEGWYPYSSLAPPELNAPQLDRSLALLDWLVHHELSGIAPQQILLAGFAQGACLALEHALQSGRPYRAVLAFHGVVMSRDRKVQTQTRFHLCCSTNDPLIPAWKVRESHEWLCLQGASSQLRLYEGMHEQIPPEELIHIRARLGLD